jgi:predicted dehydrogenase
VAFHVGRAGPGLKQMAEAVKKLRWGVVSSGKICQDFVMAVKLGCPSMFQPTQIFGLLWSCRFCLAAQFSNFVTDSEVIAVSSRTQAAADEFGKKYGIPNCYPTLLQLVQDPNVDAVYVGTPHPYHKEAVEKALENGKTSFFSRF